MKLEDIEVKTVEKLDLRDGDVLAVHIPERISESESERVKYQIKKLFLPLRVKVLVIAGTDARLEALRVNE